MNQEDAEKTIRNLELLAALHQLPDLAALTTAEAATILRVSKVTLERLRNDKSGPPYIQGGAKGARGTNQKITYLKKDLIDYQMSLKVGNSMAAAVRRGQAFLPYANPIPKHSVYDFSTKQPFYMSGDDLLVIECVLDVTMPVFNKRLGTYRIEWLNPIHAAMVEWLNPAAKRVYAVDLCRALDETKRLVTVE